MHKINSFSLERRKGKYETWSGRSRLIQDGKVLDITLPGEYLWHQYAVADGYVFVTEYDNYEGGLTNFIFVDKKLKRVLSERCFGTLYTAQFDVKNILWEDERSFIALGRDDSKDPLRSEDKLRFTIRSFFIPYLYPKLSCQYLLWYGEPPGIARRILIALGLKQPAPPETVPPDFVMPDPTIPWEFWGNADPYLIPFQTEYHVQAKLEIWLDDIWEPFCRSLDEAQLATILENAPEVWKQWILHKHNDLKANEPAWDEFRLVYYQNRIEFKQLFTVTRIVIEIFAALERKLFGLPDTVPPDFVMPDPTVPWELWEVADPHAVYGTMQGWAFRYWLRLIWEPFWDSLDEDQRTALLEKAPEAWKAWMLDWHKARYDYKHNLEAFRLYYYQHQYSFDWIAESGLYSKNEEK